MSSRNARDNNCSLLEKRSEIESPVVQRYGRLLFYAPDYSREVDMVSITVFARPRWISTGEKVVWKRGINRKSNLNCNYCDEGELRF